MGVELRRVGLEDSLAHNGNGFVSLRLHFLEVLAQVLKQGLHVGLQSSEELSIYSLRHGQKGLLLFLERAT